MSDVHCPARIIVARHGEAEYETPEMNAAGGSLTALGREQARDLGERLRQERVAARRERARLHRPAIAA